MNAPAQISADAPRSCIIVLEDPEVARLERRLAFVTDIYRRRVWPTLIGSASILGVVIILAQLAKWIAR